MKQRIFEVEHGKAYCEYVAGHGWYVNSIVVDSEYRRQGIGTILMEKIVNKLGCPIFLYASTEYGMSREALDCFYARFGFQKLCRDDIKNLSDFPYRVNMIKE